MEVASVQAVCAGCFWQAGRSQVAARYLGCCPSKPAWLQMGSQPGACGAALLIPLAPDVPPKMGLCPGTPYRDLAARPEHLDRAQGYPREVEEDLNHGPQQPIQPGRISSSPGELSQLPSLLYTASLVFVVHIGVPCRRDLCVGLMCRVVLGSRLKLVRHVLPLEHRPAGAHGDALLFQANPGGVAGNAPVTPQVGPSPEWSLRGPCGAGGDTGTVLTGSSARVSGGCPSPASGGLSGWLF